MKITILKMIAVAGIVTGSVFTSNAQITKGSLMLGGSFGANITMESTNKLTGSSDIVNKGYTEWNLSPTIGYFISNGLAMGLSLEVNSIKIRTATSGNGRYQKHVMSNNLGVALFARKYKEILKNTYFYTEGSLSYVKGSFTDQQADGLTSFEDGDKVDYSNIGVNITPGIAYFISPKLGIDFALNNLLGYNLTTNKIKYQGIDVTNETSFGSFNVGAGLTPTLGLFYYIYK